MAGFQIDIGGGAGQTIGNNPQVQVDNSWIRGATEAVAPLVKGALTGYAEVKAEDAFAKGKAGVIGQATAQQNQIAGLKQQLVSTTLEQMKTNSPQLGNKMKEIQDKISRIQRGATAGSINEDSAKAMIDNILATASASYPWAKSEIKTLGAAWRDDGELNAVIEGTKFDREMAEKSYDERRGAMMKFNMDINNPVHEAIFDNYMAQHSQADMQLNLMNQQWDAQKAKYGMVQTGGQFANSRIEGAWFDKTPGLVNSALAEITATKDGTPDQKLAVLLKAKTDSINAYLLDATKANVPQEDRNKTVSQLEDQWKAAEEAIKANDEVAFQKRSLDLAESNHKLGMYKNHGGYMVMKDLGLTTVYKDMADTMSKALIGTPEDKAKAELMMKEFGMENGDLSKFPQAMDEYIKTGGASSVVKLAGLVYAQKGGMLPPGTDGKMAGQVMLAAAEPPASVTDAQKSKSTVDALSGNTMIASYIAGNVNKEEYKKYFMQHVSLLANNFKQDVNVGFKDGKIGVINPETKEFKTFQEAGLLEEGTQNTSLGNTIGAYIDRDTAAAQLTVPQLEKIVKNIPEAATWVGDGLTRGEFKYEPTLPEAALSAFQGMMVRTFGSVEENVAYNTGTRVGEVLRQSKGGNIKNEGLFVEYPDGTKKEGGTVAWRNNNPGNLVDGDFARKHGGFKSGNRFAAFPTPEAGLAAQKALLLIPKYQSKTVGEMMMSYAPPHENNTEAYLRHILPKGRSPTDKMSSLSSSELDYILNKMHEKEGIEAGRIH